MRGWYDIVGMDFRSRADMAGVQESVVQLDALIAREIERGIAPEKIFLAGFSQGGAIILTTALAYRAAGRPDRAVHLSARSRQRHAC